MQDLQTILAAINESITTFQTEATAQAEKGNKAAGTRARKASNELSKLLKQFRAISTEVAKTKND